MKTFKTFIEQAKWRKTSSAHKTPDWYKNEIGSERDDYDRLKSKKHDGGKPKQSVADTPKKYGSLENRPEPSVKKDGKLSKTGVNRLKGRIKARNENV